MTSDLRLMPLSIATVLALIIFTPLHVLAQASEDARSRASGWRIKFDQSGSHPVIADGVLYVGSAEGAVYALDLLSGETKWLFQTGATMPSATSGPLVTMPQGASTTDQMTAGLHPAERRIKQGIRRVDMTPAVGKGTVFIGSGDLFFYALDAATGKERWSYQAGSGMASVNNSIDPVPAPVLRDDTVYFVSEAGLHALDPLTGKRRWLFETLQESAGPAIQGRKRPPSRPVMADGAILLTAWPFSGSFLQGSSVYSVDPTSGKARWTTHLDDLDIGEPATAKGLVFVAARSTMYAMDSSNGRIKWQFFAERKFGTSTLLVAGNAIYFLTDRQLSALELETGRLLWRFNADQILGGLRSDHRHIYVTTQKDSLFGLRQTIHALRIDTGQEQWSRPQGRAAIVHDGVVYADGERLHAIDAATGRGLWSFKGTERESTVLVSDGRVFLMSATVTYLGTSQVSQGYLYAIDAKTGQLLAR